MRVDDAGGAFSGVNLTLYDRTGHRKYLTAEERDAFLSTVESAPREGRHPGPRNNNSIFSNRRSIPSGGVARRLNRVTIRPPRALAWTGASTPQNAKLSLRQPVGH